MLLLTGFSVGASLLLVAVFFVAFGADAADAAQYFVPGFVVPLVVAPIVIHVLLGLAFALDAAHAQAAAQQAELQRLRQLDLVGRLAGGLAHDFNNLLTVVRANVAALGGAAAHAELAAIDDAALRGARLTRRLLAISHHEEVALAPASLSPLLRETAELLHRVLPAGIELTMPTSVPDTVLKLDRDAVQQALLNLVLNARDAMDGQGALALSVYTPNTDASEWLVVEVRDSGPGMSADLLARATEAFFSTKAVHEGTGLGLAIVQRTMEQHGGRLVLESTVGVGTCAALWFPVPAGAMTVAPSDAASTPALSKLPAPQTLSTSSRTVDRQPYAVLVVDDEAPVRIVTVRTVERMGHRVTGVASMDEALAWLAAGGHADVIVSDITMPGGSGIDLVSQLRDIGRPTPVLLVSGFALDGLDDTLTADPSVALLAKPWSRDELAASIDQVTRRVHTPATV
jgi:signal transduction histidine kinase/ActR/RegA family two-component response regulator